MKAFQKLTTWLMLLVCLSLTTTACSDDDEENNEINKSALVGTWQFQSDEDIEITTFISDGTFKSAVKLYDVYGDGKWIEVNLNGTYEVEDNVLTLAFENGITTSGIIKKLTSTSLTIEDQYGDLVIYKKV